MRVSRLKINGFRGANKADLSFGKHSVLVGPNNCGKTTIVEALALVFGRDRMIKRLTEHDFFGSAPDEKARILIIVTITGFATNDPAHYPTWFGAARGGTEKWLDPETNELHATQGVARHLAVQIGFAARFDLEELEAVTIRFFVDDEATVGDPFSEDAHVVQVPGTTLQELGFFLVPASRTWDRWISFSSELQDFPVEDHPISRVGDHLNGVTGGAEGDDSYGAPGRAHSLGGASPLHSRHGQVLAEGNGVPGDRESEGSRKQSAGATNRKRIEASPRGKQAVRCEARYMYGTR